MRGTGRATTNGQLYQNLALPEALLSESGPAPEEAEILAEGLGDWPTSASLTASGLSRGSKRVRLIELQTSASVLFTR